MSAIESSEQARARLAEQLALYQPVNEQEMRDQALIASCLNAPDVFLRSNLLYHMTASAWITNARRDRILLAHHHLFNSWTWLGGHADGDADLLRVALKEAREESGLADIRPLSEDICSLEVLSVNGHVKRGQYVSCHLHLNVTYLLEADDRQTPVAKPDENSGVAWFLPEEAISLSTQPWFQERIYPKLNARLATFRKSNAL